LGLGVGRFFSKSPLPASFQERKAMLDRAEEILYNDSGITRRWQYDSQIEHHAELEVVLPEPSVNIVL